MKIENKKSITSEIVSNRTRLIAGVAFATLLSHAAIGALAPVDLGTAGNFVILTKTGISTVPASTVTGDIGVSPIDSTAITGFSLILDSTTQFSRSTQVTGKVYAPDYASPSAANLTTAVSDMATAYVDAAGRTLPDHTELGSGSIGGLTLAPGLYKWGTGVSVLSDVTLSGGPNDVWIFQISGDLTIASSTRVNLSGGAQAKNIFWQVAGGVGVTLGTTSHVEGIILAAKGIILNTGASLNGRLLAQAAVTLEANAVKAPTSPASVVLYSASVVTGPYAPASGQSVNPETRTVTAPQQGSMAFYRLWSNETLTVKDITTSAGNVVITY